MHPTGYWPRVNIHLRDVNAMVSAHASPSLIHTGHPNNPTVIITPQADIERIVANLLERTVILLDEAHIYPFAELFGR